MTTVLLILAWVVFGATLTKSFFVFLDWVLSKDGDRLMRRQLDELWDRLQRAGFPETLRRIAVRALNGLAPSGSASVLVWTVWWVSIGAATLLTIPGFFLLRNEEPTGHWDKFLLLNWLLATLFFAPMNVLIVWTLVRWLRSLASPTPKRKQKWIWLVIFVLAVGAHTAIIVVGLPRMFERLDRAWKPVLVVEEPTGDEIDLGILFMPGLFTWLPSYLIGALIFVTCLGTFLLAFVVMALGILPKAAIDSVSWLLFRVTTDSEPVFKQVGNLCAFVLTLTGGVLALLRAVL